MIVAGFGFRRGAAAAAFSDALAASGAGHIDAVATLADKAALLQSYAAAKGYRVILIAVEDAQHMETITQSDHSVAAKGVTSVAEAVALAAAGPGARLLGPRAVSADRTVTCALAEGVGP